MKLNRDSAKIVAHAIRVVAEATAFVLFFTAIAVWWILT
jgi:hypothetical protein